MSDGHVPWRRLVDRRDGLLSPRRAADADAHLAGGCGECGETIRAIERLVAAIVEGPPEAPPRDVESEAVALYRRTWLASASDVDREAGVLIFDQSQADEFATALRAAPGATRRLLWRVGAHEVDASLVAGRVGADLIAQFVAGGDDPDAVVSGFVAARDERGVVARARVERDGRFTFRGLARGVHVIEGRVDGVAFALPPLRVE